MKCKLCMMEVNEKATRCPYCRSNLNLQKNPLEKIVIIGFALLFLFWIPLFGVLFALGGILMIIGSMFIYIGQIIKNNYKK